MTKLHGRSRATVAEASLARLEQHVIQQEEELIRTREECKSTVDETTATMMSKTEARARSHCAL